VVALRREVTLVSVAPLRAVVHRGRDRAALVELRRKTPLAYSCERNYALDEGAGSTSFPRGDPTQGKRPRISPLHPSFVTL